MSSDRIRQAVLRRELRLEMASGVLSPIVKCEGVNKFEKCLRLGRPSVTCVGRTPQAIGAHEIALIENLACITVKNG